MNNERTPEEVLDELLKNIGEIESIKNMENNE